MTRTAVCNEPGCHELVDGGSRCPTHKRPAWAGSRHRQRPRTGWAEQARARKIIRRYGGVCHVCGQAGATEVDHVIALAHGGPDNESNLRPIHAEPCHREKTAREAQGHAA